MHRKRPVQKAGAMTAKPPFPCAILYCAESGAVQELWAENDRVIACPPGPILTAGLDPAGSCK